MAVFPQKPRTGQKVLQGLYNSVCQIIDYLPSLEVKGDNSSTSVTKTSNGTIVHTTNNNNVLNQNRKYYGWHGVDISLDTYIACTLTGGTNIAVNYYEQGHQGEDEYALEYPTINCTLSGGRDIQITPQGLINYTGSGGGGTICGSFNYPDYYNLRNDDYTIPCGIGISYLLPVQKNKNIGFYTDAGNGYAFGTFASSLGTEDGYRFHMANGETYVPSTDGWVRLSVFDDGTHNGSCLRFTDNIFSNPFDWTHSATPLYRFHNLSGAGGVASAIEYTGVSPIVVNNDTHQISFSGTIPGPGGQCSGLGHPDYEQLRNENSAYANVSGQGISFLLPVEKGQSYEFYAPNGNGKVIGTYAASLETGLNPHRRDGIANGISFVPEENGFVRISVFDDGTNQGQCLKFYKNKSQNTTGMPLYRFKKKQQHLSADNVTISVSEQGIISGKYVGDGSKIQVVGNTISWIGGAIGGDFKAPNYAKFPATDAGETAVGLGTTFLVPVASGKSVYYSADGGTIVAQWIPCEGSNTNMISVSDSSLSQTTTPEDGYVRISVIDAGTLSAGCVKLYVDNKALPLHKFAKFNYSSGAIYDGGRYIDIVETSTRINSQTQLEEQYTLEHPIINNTLTGGRFITIQEEENNVALEYPRINCDLTEGNLIQITTAGIINCSLTGLDQLANTPGYITNASVPQITPYFAGSGLVSSALLDNSNKLTGIEFSLNNQFYNTLSTITFDRISGKILSSDSNNNLTWAENTGNELSTVYDLLSEGPNIKLTKLANGKTQISGTPEGSGGGGGDFSVSYISTSGIYQAASNSRYIVRFPHCPLAWYPDAEDQPWPEGWQPPKESEYSDAYISQQWPLYAYYYNQDAYPALPCGYLCSLYTWAAGGTYTGHWDIIIKLPSVSEKTVVEVINYSDTALAVVTENGKQIIPQSFSNSMGDSQHSFAINSKNQLYSFYHGNYRGCCKMVFYYDPAPPYSPQRTPYTPATMQQLTSGGCWFAQMFCN